MNNKLYVFLRPSIAGLGGSLIYTSNKISFLKNNGYDVLYYHANGHKGEFQIEKLLEYKDYYEERLLLPSYYFDKDTITDVINRFQEYAKSKRYESIIIESETILLATWGEVIASIINARHIIYLLAEKNTIYDSITYEFLRFKQRRKELVGISTNSIKDMFKGKIEIPTSKSLSLPAYCYNTVDDVEFPDIIPSSESINIGSLGRLDKPYVKYAFRDLKRYVKRKRDVNYNLIIIGGGVEKNEILETFADTDNLKIFYIGNIYPIPLKLLLKIDVFISSSGSSLLTSKLGKLTITYDASDYMPIGILGITTDSILNRKKGEPAIGLDVLLDDILVKKKYNESIDENYLVKLNDFSFDSHLLFLEETEKELIYFDFAKLTKPIRLYEKKMLLRMLGFNRFFRLRNFFHK